MIDMINKKYNIEITVLSPLAIGAGAEKDWVKGMDFVVKEGKIYLLNLKKMQQAGIDLATLTTHFAKKDEKAVIALIGSKLDAVSDRVLSLPTNSDNDIKSFIKNELSGKPIIPGSSLKGAVRSVILEYLLNGQKQDFLNETRRVNNNSKQAEEKWFGDSNRGDELMRFIKFADAEFDETALVNTKIFNLFGGGNNWRGGWKHAANRTDESFKVNGFNTLYECLMPNQKSLCSIMLSETGFNAVGYHKLQEDKHNLFNIGILFDEINRHTYNYISKEIKFFTRYSQADCADKIISSLKSIQKQIPDAGDDVKTCILKMSAGSGFHSITGDWQYDDYEDTGYWPQGDRNRTHHADAPKYKSRKVAINNGSFALMGFIKLTINQ